MAAQHAPALRAYSGLAGSALSVVTEPAEVLQEAKRRGRPRKFKTAADKQRSYRKRKQLTAELQTPPVGPLKSAVNGDSAGVYMTGAPHGKGKLISGGYGGKKIAEVTAAHERAEHGRRVTPNGCGTAGQSVGRNEDAADEINETDNKLEHENSFVKTQERSGAFDRPATPLSKKQFEASVRRIFCAQHSTVPTNTPNAFQDCGQWILLFTAVPNEEGDVWTLACGCTRTDIKNNE